MNTKVSITILVIAAIIIIGFVVLRGPVEAPTTDETTTGLILTDNNAVNANNQSVGSSVVVGLVVLQDPGYVVIHEDTNGSPGAVIGHGDLLSGESRDVVVPLDRASRDGEALYAMLHTDNGDGIYEFPGDDVPVKDDDGNVVLVKFIIGAEAEPSVREISVSGTEFSFSPSLIRVQAGERVRLVFQNVGRAPHNWTVEGPGITTKTIGGGQTDIIEFTAPEAGNLTVFCSVPGHRQAGMVGSLIIE